MNLYFIKGGHMGLFTEIYPLCREMHLTLLISANTANGTLTISVMPRAKAGAKLDAFKDLTMTSTPDEFDAGFLQAFTGYRDTLLPLMAQAEAAKAALTQTLETKPVAKPKQLPRESAPVPVQGSKSPAVSKLTDEPKQANGDPDTDWMKNRQPELF
ncbi:PRTRC system protein E [Duganella sp. FT92W]|uniref:PRTRC system protein E n=1 Tax=Pseudoduganella rivuli TaxID=2666085 RepID=A0A7X2IID5_9BURK|nr:PRTRC system protein E [Pseudoduganella rivuli]MRV70602.1 PRTRC system protein E [Pseudoduganella rivuli]